MPVKKVSQKKEDKKKKESLMALDISIGGVTLVQKAVFAKHLAVMLKSGITITEALGIALESSEGKLKRIVRQIQESVKSGRTLSDSLARYPKVFSGLFINAVKAGEASGTLEQNLNSVAEHLEAQKELIAKIKGAMLYPIIVLIASFVLGMGVTFFVLPKITPLFEGLDVDLPATTRGLIWFSHFVQDHGLILFISIVGVTVFLLWLVRQKFSRPVTHWLLLRLPILKDIVYKSNLITFTKTMGLLLKSGLNIDEAMDISKETLGNFYYSRSVTQISKRIDKGFSLSDNLKEYYTLYPTIVVEMVRVGEESGNLTETLLYLSDFYETELDEATKSLAAAIEPVLLIFIGLVVGFLALSIITPIYDITGNIRR
ncbi:MAG: hypothetical protein GF349_03565 [Candidatus Magasanikbacteria bacterium]|nr:hypothetical protein [Candidatus Magasanikbacteria bacterium]